jgi:hypothetical protein
LVPLPQSDTEGYQALLAARDITRLLPLPEAAIAWWLTTVEGGDAALARSFKLLSNS